MDVVTAPADLFAELRPHPASAGTGFAVVCLAAVLAILSNATVLISKGAMEDVMRRQEKAMDQQVAQGKMTAEQASRGLEQMRGMSPMIFAGIGAVAAAIFTFLSSLGWALVVFLAGKVLGGPVSFGKAYEITGLAFVIACLAIVATSALIILRDSLAMPTAALFVEDFDPGNKMHNLLQAISPFTIWFVAVLAIGLACSGGISIRKCLIALLGFWAVKAILFVFLGFGQLA